MHDEIERIKSYICTVLSNILEYIYISQIAKRRKRHVFDFNMQITTNY